jgi:rubrerythrin
MTREKAIKILRKEIECLSHTKCEDCILEAACDPIKTTPYDSEYIEVYEMAIKALEQEPKTGRLYNDIYDHYLCGNCKTIVMDYDNFCPNCGARMAGSEDK